MKHLIRPHEGIISFIWASHVNRTLYTSTVHVATLIIGAMSGPAVAGLFKIAQESAAVLIKPAQLFTETVYPEMTKIAVTRQFSRLWNVIRHSALVSGAIAGFILLLVFLLGESLLGLFFGAEYASAYDILVLLMIGAAITMTSFALEPALFSIGRPGISMYTRVFTTILNITVLILLLPEIGLAGAGIAAIAGSLATALLLLFFSRRLIKKSADDAPEGPE